MIVKSAIDEVRAKGFTTKELRENFLIQDLFKPDELNFTYTYYDRMIVGGISPVNKEVSIIIDKKIIGADYLLYRREMGIINIAGEGNVSVDGKEYTLGEKDGLYIGMGSKDIKFNSKDKNNPAKFYLLSAPAHTTYPTEKISIKEAEPQHLGSDDNSNKRTIYKYIHPDGVKSCQLVMGLTIMEPKNVWNTMPPHMHPRRIEVYFYFDIPENQVVFHYMGEPDETRHLVVRNHEAVLSPSWSIHAGSGTQNYTFIWGMAGENQTFSDMDGLSMDDIK